MRTAIGPARAQRQVDAQTFGPAGVVGQPDGLQERVRQVRGIAVDTQRIDGLELETAEAAHLHRLDFTDDFA